MGGLIVGEEGVKQASLVWWCTLDKSMKELGFTRLKSDARVFITNLFLLTNLRLGVWDRRGCLAGLVRLEVDLRKNQRSC